MPRILHVIQSLDGRLGGPPAVCMRLAAAQRLAGHEVGVVSYASQSLSEAVSGVMRELPGGDGVKMHFLRSSRWSQALLCSDLPRWLTRRAQDWDLFHFHGIWDPAVFFGGVTAVLAGKPFVVTAHGMLDDWGMRQGRLRPIKKRLALMFGLGHVLRSARFVHALAEGERDGVKKYCHAERVEIVPNGIFLDEIPTAAGSGAVRQKISGLGNARFVLFLGRLHRMKGIDRLLRGFSEVARSEPEVLLVIAGPNFGDLEYLRALTLELGLGNRVLFPGPVYGPAKYDLIKECCVFCQLSRYEGFSVALLEALACGVPVVASAACRFPEIASVGAGIVTEVDQCSVASALRVFLSDSDRCREAALAGRQLVAAQFTWQNVAARMNEAYIRSGLLGSS
jgi:glycosyltransferase involved in cell wall biosynthesis